MSFSHDVKDEICQLPLGDVSVQMPELEALIRLASEIVLSFGGAQVSFQTTSARVARRFLSLLKNYIKCDVDLMSKRVNKLNQMNTYLVNITSMSEILMEEFSMLSESKNKDNITESDETKLAFLRGAFLAKGSVNSPEKSNYHLEIYTPREGDAIFIQSLMNSFDLNAKLTKRRNDIVIYMKELESIKAFLRLIGVSNAVFKIEEVQIEREVLQSITRSMNIEGANDAKSLKAAQEQLDYVRYLEYNYPLEKMDPKLLMVMKERKIHPEASLNELVEIINRVYGESLTKSGLNHRIRRLKELADKHKANIKK